MQFFPPLFKFYPHVGILYENSSRHFWLSRTSTSSSAAPRTTQIQNQKDAQWTYLHALVCRLALGHTHKYYKYKDDCLLVLVGRSSTITMIYLI